MRVLLVNTSEMTGGAAIAANRLLKALNQNGIEATMLVRDRLTDDSHVLTVPHHGIMKLKFVYERFYIWLINHFQKKNLFMIDPAVAGADITGLKAFQEADVIHLHWINQGMLSLDGIRRILESGKPVVWTMHDMWACAGICHYSDTCSNRMEECGNCPLLVNPGKKDLSHRIYKKKEEVFKHGRIVFVGCSEWITKYAKESPLLSRFQKISIPNPIDTHFYHPMDKIDLRKKMGLPTEKKFLLFTAYNVMEERKGIKYLIEAVEILRQRNEHLHQQLCVLLVGQNGELAQPQFSCECHALGYVTDKQRMLDIYNAADLLAMPTLMDNLPNTIVEAMACGKPCVGSNVGGLPQMIAHGVDGYLSRVQDAEDFAEGITQTLCAENYSKLSEAARNKALNTYSEEAVARRYTEIYQQEIKESSK